MHQYLKNSTRFHTYTYLSYFETYFIHESKINVEVQLVQIINAY